MSYGAGADMPQPGHYDADAEADLAVYRPSTGTWYIHYSSGGDPFISYGAAGDVPLPLPWAIRRAFFP
ncbi:MAG: hypothetical protein ACR2MO_10430 [Acidimicrobiales bacterium]